VEDLDESTLGYNQVASSSANNGSGFAPIGNESSSFTGTFDGNNHTITNLRINRSGSDNVGLFGVVGQDLDGFVIVSDVVIESVGLENATVFGNNSVGGLVGRNGAGTVDTSYTTGTMTGNNSVGGLVGKNFNGTVESSYATGRVSGSKKVGGLSGETYFGTVESSYVISNVTGNNSVGALIGTNLLVEATVDSSYWNINTTGQTESDGGGAGLTTAEMKGRTAVSNMDGFDFTSTWDVLETATDGVVSYPVLRNNTQTPAPGRSPVAPANFTVEAVGVISPAEGNSLSVTAEVTNVGDLQGTQTVELSIPELGSDSMQVTLAGGENTTEALNIPTSVGDAGFYTATLTTANNSVSTGVSVRALPNFTVSDIQPAAAAVTNGTEIDVSADIENTGDIEGTQDITLSIAGVSQTQTETLAGGANTTVTFQNIDTGLLGPGSYTHTIASANDSASGSLTVQQSQADIVIQSIDAPDSITPDENLTISYSIENIGDIEGTESSVNLLVNGTVEDSDRSLTVAPNETMNGTLTAESDAYDKYDQVSWTVEMTDWEHNRSGKTFVGSRVELDEPSNRVRSIAFSPDEDLVAIGDGDAGKTPKVHIYSTDNWELQTTLSEIPSNNVINGIEFSDDGQYLAYTGAWDDSTVYVHNTDNWNLEYTRSAGHSQYAVEFVKDDKYIVHGGQDHLLSISTPSETVATYDVDGRILSIESNETYLAATTLEGTTYVFEMADNPDDWTLRHKLDESESVHDAVSISANGQFVASGTTSDTYVHRIDSGSVVESFEGASQSALDFSPAGEHFAYGSTDEESINVVATGTNWTPVTSIEASSVRGELTYSPAGTWLAYSDDTSVYVVPAPEEKAESYFEVANVSTNSPVTEGDALDVTATIENTGDKQGTQTVTLDVGTLGTNSTQVTLRGGANTTETFTVGTSAGDNGTYTAMVSSENDSASQQVTVTAPDTSGMTVAVQPTEERVTVGQTTTFDVVVENATSGVSGYEIDIGLNSTAASIVGYQLTTEGTSGPLDNTTISPDNSSISLEAALLDTAQPPAGEVTVANLTLAVSEPAVIEVEPTQARVIGNDSREYEVGLTGGVVKAVAPPPVIGDTPPTDPDGDGKYEDVRGDGGISILDVQTLFNRLDTPVMQEYAAAFKFSGTGDDVTVLDVQALFNELTSEENETEPTPTATLTIIDTSFSFEPATPVEPAQAAVTSYTVTNTGDSPGTQDIVFLLDGKQKDSVSHALAPGETTDGGFSTTVGETVNFTATLRTDDDSVTRSFSPAPSYFEFTSHDLGFDAGTATGTYTVENTGDFTSSRTIEFEVNGTVRDTNTHTLAPGERAIGSFSVAATGSRPASDPLTVAINSQDERESQTFTVGMANFVVQSVSATYDRSSEQALVDFTVKNTGESSGAQDIEVRTNPGSVGGNETFSSTKLDPGAAFTRTDVGIPISAAGEVALVVDSEQDSGSDSVTVNSGQFQITNPVAPSSVDAGNSFTFITTVTNTGDLSKSGFIDFYIDSADTGDSTSVDLAPGESTTVAFSYTSSRSDAPGITVTARVKSNWGNGQSASVDINADPRFSSTSVTDAGSSVECNWFSSRCAHELAVEVSYSLDDPSDTADNVTANVTTNDSDANDLMLTHRPSWTDHTWYYDDTWSNFQRTCEIKLDVTYRVYDNDTVTDTAQESAAIDMGC